MDSDSVVEVSSEEEAEPECREKSFLEILRALTQKNEQLLMYHQQQVEALESVLLELEMQREIEQPVIECEHIKKDEEEGENEEINGVKGDEPAQVADTKMEEVDVKKENNGGRADDGDEPAPAAEEEPLPTDLELTMHVCHHKKLVCEGCHRTYMYSAKVQHRSHTESSDKGSDEAPQDGRGLRGGLSRANRAVKTPETDEVAAVEAVSPPPCGGQSRPCAVAERSLEPSAPDEDLGGHVEQNTPPPDQSDLIDINLDSCVSPESPVVKRIPDEAPQLVPDTQGRLSSENRAVEALATDEVAAVEAAPPPPPDEAALAPPAPKRKCQVLPPPATF